MLPSPGGLGCYWTRQRTILQLGCVSCSSLSMNTPGTPTLTMHKPFSLHQLAPYRNEEATATVMVTSHKPERIFQQASMSNCAFLSPTKKDRFGTSPSCQQPVLASNPVFHAPFSDYPYSWWPLRCVHLILQYL